MRFSKLRIAWSVGWGLLAALLIALWVRSFWLTNLISRIDSRKIATTIGSQYGALYFAHFDAAIAYKHQPSNSTAPCGWAYKSLRGYVSSNGLFVWERKLTSLYIALPHWLIAIATTMIGTVAWLRWRFSTRTLLIATTLVAVRLGLVVWLRLCPTTIAPDAPGIAKSGGLVRMMCWSYR